MIVVGSGFLVTLCFFVSGALIDKLLGHRNWCVCYATLFIKSVCDHYSVNFLLKWRVF